jgi:hypothetical protein
MPQRASFRQRQQSYWNILENFRIILEFHFGGCEQVQNKLHSSHFIMKFYFQKCWKIYMYSVIQYYHLLAYNCLIFRRTALQNGWKWHFRESRSQNSWTLGGGGVMPQTPWLGGAFATTFYNLLLWLESPKITESPNAPEVDVSSNIHITCIFSTWKDFVHFVKW